jgi:hypothetical protein
MTATSPDRPTDEQKSDADQNAIAQVEGEIRAFVRKDVVRNKQEVAPWRRNQAQAAQALAQAQTSAQADQPRELPMDNVNSLIGRVAGQSVEQIDRLIADLEGVRSLLRGEGERLQRELAGYADMSQTAMTSIRVIGEGVAQWKANMGNRPPEHT